MSYDCAESCDPIGDGANCGGFLSIRARRSDQNKSGSPPGLMEAAALSRSPGAA